MQDTPVHLDIDDLPGSLMFHRIHAAARLLGLAVSIDGAFLSLALDTSAASRVPSWSAGEVNHADYLSGDGTVPGGIACPIIFGDLHAMMDPRRFGHIPLACFVLPLPARQLLATLLDETESHLLTLNSVDPDGLLARINAADAAGQTVLGRSPCDFVWWSIPVMSPILRAENPEVALVLEGQTALTQALHEAYWRVANRAHRLFREIEVGVPSFVIETERDLIVCGVDELLVNVDLEQPRAYTAEEGGPARSYDALSLFFSALGSKFVEMGERNVITAAGANLWIAKAAQIGRGLCGDTPRLAALWRLAADRPTEPLDDEILKEMGVWV